ncbi:MAG: transglutaminase domain-containing protein [Dehalococcoidia bacterium]
MSVEREGNGSSSETGARPDAPEGRGNAWRKVFRRYFPLILILWILFVLYPNPLNLFISVHRFLNPDVDPAAVRSILDDFPSDPVAIEKAVRTLISYGLDWELHGMPWYFPTVEEVLERGQGDCKARALVFASVLQAKDIPSQVISSPIHVWVDYEGKEETRIENTQVKFYQLDPETGERRFKIPDIGLSEIMSGWRQQLWTPMPTYRRVLLFSGLLGLVAARVILFNKKALGITARKCPG